VPAAQAKPPVKQGSGQFPGPADRSPAAYCAARCRIEGERTELTCTHQLLCLRSECEPSLHAPSPEPPHSKLKKIRCPYCDASTHMALEDCWDCNKQVRPRQNTTNQPLISSTMLVQVTTLQIGSYSVLDTSPYGILRGNQIEDRQVYLAYYR